ncbi:MAG TPA: zinc ribbon domain-containing protein [Thermoplasmata archaeon]
MDQTFLVVGILLVVCGGGAFLWADQEIDEMGVLIYAYPEDYEAYQTIGYIGLIAAGVGVLFVLIGAVSKGTTAQTAQKPEIRPVAHPGVVNFCQYCGAQLTPGATRCNRCGRAMTGGEGQAEFAGDSHKFG